MKLSSQQRETVRIDLEISMTSMIDVVFLLLIFFLVTTTFIKPERQLTSNIQVEETDAGLQMTDLEPAVVDVYRAGESVVYQMGAVKSSQLEELVEIMSNFKNKSDGAFVRVGTEVPFEHVAKIIGTFKSAGFANVSYLPVK